MLKSVAKFVILLRDQLEIRRETMGFLDREIRYVYNYLASRHSFVEF